MEEHFNIITELFESKEPRTFTSLEEEGLSIVDGCMPTDIKDTNWDLIEKQ